MVWQRFAKSPRIACAGSSPAASAKLFIGPVAQWNRARLCEGRGRPFESGQVHHAGVAQLAGGASLRN